VCRNIKKLRGSEGSPTDEELRAAALQFVRRTQVYLVPSARNQVAFDRTVEEITRVSGELFRELESHRESIA
jgi:hypothetical protein